jgi:hypothetical protein
MSRSHFTTFWRRDFAIQKHEDGQKSKSRFSPLMQVLSVIKPSSKVGIFLAVLLVWGIYSRLLMVFWAYYASVNPLLDWAIHALLPEKRFLFYALIYTHDILVNVMLALPIGFLFRRYALSSIWVAVIATVILIFLWDYQQVLWGGTGVLNFFSSFGAIKGAFTTLGLLPFVYYLAGLSGGKYAT